MAFSVRQPAFDPLVDQVPARYVVGIDLGTTNSAVCYVDTEERPWRVRDLAIPQITALGQVEARETLPSFHFQATEAEAASGALRLPWDTENPRATVGAWARDEGGRTAGRLIASAKSWLCHSGVDRTADLLPWHAAPDVERLSPLEASARYLQHIHHAWNYQFPASPLAEQDVVLTLPASFDEVARELTVEAAARAGLRRVVLIEEPQAAFYAWVYKHRENWFERVTAGQKILICDIGGGTTDFTLLRVRPAAGAGAAAESVEFHRVAVGEHLILGGDNLDLALARFVEPRLAGDSQLDGRQWDMLVRSCRRVKETLLSEPAPPRMTIHLASSGSRLIGGGLQAEVEGEEVRRLLVDGFLPRVEFGEPPQRRQSGFQEFGLPYAQDAAITRYLSQFLKTHAHAGSDQAEADDRRAARPDVVLFNGGFFASPLLRERLVEVIASWFRTDDDPDWKPEILDHDRLDLAVARGAAYYGMVRRGEGVRITANLARSYYIGVESDPPAAVCLLPGDTAPGTELELSDRTFALQISTPVEFPLYVSSTRLTDRPGELIEIQPEQLRPLPPIRTVLRTERRRESGTVPVRLHARLSEIGTIELWCTEVGTERSWRLQFDVRSATQTDIEARETVGEAAGVIDEETWRRCEETLAAVFGPNATEKPEGLMKQLAAVLGSDRSQWPPSLLRRMWEALMQWESGRRRSPVHEARWLNLVGFALRPGYGMAVDDWRVSETWRTVRGKLAHGAAMCRVASYILWRRIAGGLSAGQQRALAEPLLASLRDLGRRALKGKGKDLRREASDAVEMWTLVASLELLPVNMKLEIGNLIAELIERQRLENQRQALLWSLGRLGARVPVYGPLNTVVPADVAEDWLKMLLKLPAPDASAQLAIMQLARRTDDRYRDISPALRERAAAWLDAHNAPAHFRSLVLEGGQLEQHEQDQVFGESLPKGLRIQ